ncbi:MAG: permease [Alphaproteobacteria bacterium]|nr:permease [Alphaproteobacteria bacterium]
MESSAHQPSCCSSDHGDHSHGNKRFDIILHGSLLIIFLALVGYMFAPQITPLHDFAYAIIDLAHKMWWGVVLGITFVGLMSKIPKEYFQAILGRGDTVGGIFRATFAGLLLDLCSHGILLIGAKLYERGASLAQVMAFLIASPWNSLSLTIILIALIGLKWTLVFIAGSALIAVVTGLIYLALVNAGVLPKNPHSIDLPQDFSLIQDAKSRLKRFKPNRAYFKDVITSGLSEATMLLRWLLLGMILAAAIRAFVPPDIFTNWFGPSLMGLVLTLVATTIIEVCSEGSAPIAAEIINGAGAPGNGFVFLMAGVATDYTEIMIIREFSKSWWVALSLPLITVPQVLLLGYIMNVAGG